MSIALRIAGMTCQQCAKTVEQALSALAGVKSSVAYPEGIAHVETPVDFGTEKLISAIQAEGFGAGLVAPMETLLALLRQVSQGDPAVPVMTAPKAYKRCRKRPTGTRRSFA